MEEQSQNRVQGQLFIQASLHVPTLTDFIKWSHLIFERQWRRKDFNLQSFAYLFVISNTGPLGPKLLPGKVYTLSLTEKAVKILPFK